MNNNLSKNSLTAKSGHTAEQIFRTDLIIKISLEKYFQKNIIELNKIHGKKYDTEVKLNIQNKKIENLDRRGGSFDRRHIKDTFNNQFIRKYLTVLSLIRKNKNETQMTETQKIDFIKLCNNNTDDIIQYLQKTFIGNETEKNDYWCIMKTDKQFTKIELFIISSEKLFEHITNTIKIDIKPKKNGTCLHLSPCISLQRKGGGHTDNSPNNIQAKFKFTKEIFELCEKLL